MTHPLKTVYVTALLFLIVSLGTACSGGGSSASSTVETYLNALINKDREQLSALACADWEASALRELDSFAAVEIRLEDVSCSEAGSDGDYTVVECSGSILASYNNEDQALELSERPFLTRVEAGDWRVCGYQE